MSDWADDLDDVISDIDTILSNLVEIKKALAGKMHDAVDLRDDRIRELEAQVEELGGSV